jgi:hypothetical protein
MREKTGVIDAAKAALFEFFELPWYLESSKSMTTLHMTFVKLRSAFKIELRVQENGGPLRAVHVFLKAPPPPGNAHYETNCNIVFVGGYTYIHAPSLRRTTHNRNT